MQSPRISFYTPTYRRPQQLAACLESVQTQTRADLVEQVVIVDHVGLGVGGMFAAVPKYADALHGEYVHFLCDDDVLAAPDVVAKLDALVREHRDSHKSGPEVIIVGSQKPGGYFPGDNHGPPVQGSIDLGCFVVRRDIWRQYASRYGRRYEGDFDFINAIWADRYPGMRWVWHKDLHFVTGKASHGRYEGQWP